MITVALLICGTSLIALAMHHVHQLDMQTDRTAVLELVKRVELLEQARAQQFDPKAFEELQTKVDALRIAHGLRMGNARKG